MNRTLDALRDYIFTLDIIDTHEHLPGFEADRPMGVDVLGEYLTHYMSCDLVSAGLRQAQLSEVKDAGKPIAKRWKIVEPFWEAARRTGYGRSLDIAVKGLYGLDRIDAKTIAPLNEAFIATRAAGNTYETVLKDKSKIRLSILDDSLKSDRRFFAAAVRLDEFVLASDVRQLEELAARSGMSAIHALEDLEEATRRWLEAVVANGTACLKCPLAYVRSLRFEKATRAEAEAEFNEMRADRYVVPAWRGASAAVHVKLQDFMMHHICRLADARGMVMQVHTGIQEGNGNYVYHSDPSLLSNLFLEYRNVRFDLLHIGYPYQQVTGVLAKNFANVFIDFAWAHIVSPAAAVAALAEYLDAVPANKICGFGGDYCFVDGVYGHQHIARNNIARALAMKVDDGELGMDDARQLARMLLHDNPLSLFGLQGHFERSHKPAKVGKKNARTKTSQP